MEKNNKETISEAVRSFNRIGKVQNLPLKTLMGPYKEYEHILNPNGQADMTRLEDIFNNSYFDSIEEMLQLLLEWDYIKSFEEYGIVAVCNRPYTDYYIQPVLDKDSGFGYVDFLVVSKEVENKLYEYSREKYKRRNKRRNKRNGTFYGVKPECFY